MGARGFTCLLIALVGLGLAAVTGAALARSSRGAGHHGHKHRHGRRHRCHAGTRPDRLDKGRSLCMPTSAVPQGSASQANLRRARRLALRQPLRRKHRRSAGAGRRLTRLALDGKGQKALFRGMRRGGRNHLLATASEHLESTGPTVDGWHSSVHGDANEVQGAEGGLVVDAIAEASKKFGKGRTATQKARLKTETTASRCPDLDGKVPGRGSELTAMTTEATDKSEGSASMKVTFKAAATAEGHVGEDAKLRDYEMRGRYFVHAQIVVRDRKGKVVETNPPFLYTFVYSATGLTPGMSMQQIQSHIDVSAATAPPGHALIPLGGRLFEFDELSHEVADGAIMDIALLAQRLGNAYSGMESVWRSGKCLGVKLVAAKPRLRPGESTDVTATVSAPGGALAPGTLQVNSYGGGTVAPASAPYGGAPVHFTFTAPPGWKGGVLDAVATSRQGLGFGVVNLGAEAGGYELRLSLDAGLDTSRSDDAGNPGGERETATFDAGATVPIAGDAGSGTATGSGPIEWATYEKHVVNDAALCQDGNFGSSTTDSTGASPGTLYVDGLKLEPADGSPGVTLKVHDDKPIEHTHFVFYHGGSECGDFAQDREDWQWDSFLHNFNGYPGIVVDYVNGAEMTITGWQSGAGDVVAVKTLDQGVYQGHASLRLELLRR